MSTVEELVDKLESVFRLDKNYDAHIFHKQMAVMRGQILNLVQALKDGKTPLELVQMPVITVERLRWRDLIPNAPSGDEGYSQRFHSRYPLFSWC